MTSWKTPTPDAVDRAVRLVAKSEQHRQFFQGLLNPLWVAPLRERGMFKHPPPPVENDDDQTIRYPVWHASGYLARMAEAVPTEVLAAIQEADGTSNFRVHEDYVDAAVAMPAEIASELVPKVGSWLEGRHILIVEKLGKLLGSLADSGQADAAFALAKTLFAVRATAGPEFMGSASTHARGVLDDWDYGQELAKAMPVLLTLDANRSLRLLARLLRQAIEIEGIDDGDEFHDGSHFWRAAVEEHEQNNDRGVKNLLVSELRDACTSVAGHSDESLERVLRHLEAHPQAIFLRLRMHVLRECPTYATPHARDLLVQEHLFKDHRVRHEYYHLLGACFGRLEKEDQAHVLTWIERGADIDRWRQWVRSVRDQDPTEEDVRRFVAQWQLEKLSAIRDELPHDWASRYDDLVGEFGEPEHPDLVVHSKSFWGPTTPLNRQEILDLESEALLRFLVDWTPEADEMSPSPEGLGRELAAAAEADPGRLVPALVELAGTDPTYVRHILDGLRNALRAGSELPWDDLLPVCLAISTTVREPETESDREGRDPHWGWARGAVADLLDSGLQRSDARAISTRHREASWICLAALCDDPDPTQDFEAQHPFGNPYEGAINTTRGRALGAVVQYALWVWRSCPEADRTTMTEMMPEVTAVLDRHLDLDHEPSGAVRSVYGRFLPWLVLLDRDWVRDRRLRIFPEERFEMAAAAICGLVGYAGFYQAVYDELRSTYQWAAEHIGELTDRYEVTMAQQLGAHLMAAILRGLDTFEEGSPSFWFFARADAQTRSSTLHYIGRSALDVDPRIVEDTVRDQLVRVWTFCLDNPALPRQHADPDAARLRGRHMRQDEELAEFGSWFAAGIFNAEWSLRQLDVTLQRTDGQIDRIEEVVGRLADLAQDLPVASVGVLRRIVLSPHTSWWRRWDDSARAVFGAAIAAGADAASEATRTIHELGERGHPQFGDML